MRSYASGTSNSHLGFVAEFGWLVFSKHPMKEQITSPHATRSAKESTVFPIWCVWLYNWFQADNNNMNIFFLMNGNIFNYSLASEQYDWNGGSANATPPNPPASTNTITGEPIFTQSYTNAYNTAFNQSNVNYQKALYHYARFSSSDVNANFVPGTFGSREEYNSLSQSQSFVIHHLKDIVSVYNRNPYLFISAGSGGGAGYMYLDWIIVTYGVPYVASVS